MIKGCPRTLTDGFYIKNKKYGKKKTKKKINLETMQDSDIVRLPREFLRCSLSTPCLTA